MTTETWFPALMGYLIPAGFFLLAWGGMEAERARRAATLGLVGLAVATLGYVAVGFAFHLGGAGLFSEEPGLEGLTLLAGYRVEAGLYWGIVGLRGFFLGGGADTPQARAMFITYLPLAITAVLLPVLSLSGRVRGWAAALMGLLVGILAFPLAACWAWGGGWLASLGRTVILGHGLVDYAGSGVVYLLGGTVALGGLMAVGRQPPREEPAQMPPAHFPLLANLGALLLIVGWLGWSFSLPFHAGGATLDPARAAVNGTLAVAGATLTCLAYCSLALGHSDALMVARGAAAGLVAISAGAPFIPSWAALVVGGVAGLLLPLGVYIVDHLMRLADETAAVATTGLAGLWGLLAVSLFADGQWGQGWNGVGVMEYRTVAGQGVSGFFTSAPFLGDGPGQGLAQLAGLAAIFLLAWLIGWLPTRLGRLLGTR